MVWISNVPQRSCDKGLVARLWRGQQLLGSECAAGGRGTMALRTYLILVLVSNSPLPL